MPRGFPKTIRSKSEEAARVKLVIRAENRGDVLERVVGSFHRVKLEIEALWMVRTLSAETMRIDVTIRTDREGLQRIQADLQKVAEVRSIKAEPSRDQVKMEERKDGSAETDSVE